MNICSSDLNESRSSSCFQMCSLSSFRYTHTTHHLSFSIVYRLYQGSGGGLSASAGDNPDKAKLGSRVRFQKLLSESRSLIGTLYRFS